VNCARCGTELPSPPWTRYDECMRCGADLRACVHCVFYAPGSYNDCKESQAERITDKERANPCDYFRPGDRAAVADPREKAKASLDALFKKG
jgi:hypothetical protein